MKLKSIYSKGLLALGMVAVTVGCSDVLELEPEATWNVENFYKNESDINSALAGIHSLIASGNVFGNAVLQMNIGTDESYKLKSWNANYPSGIYDHNPASGEIRDLYRNLYGAINNINNFVKHIKPDSFDDEATYKNYLGEALFLRGFCYYHLTLWFNEVPLRLEPAVDQSSNHLAPSSLEEVYAQIIEDLTYAADNCYQTYDAEYVAGHGNSAAAHAMLAKTYLKAAGYPLQATQVNGKEPYQAAKDHCAVLINDGNYALNASYKELFLNYIQNRFDLKESLFEMVYLNGTSLGINTAGRIGYVNGLFYGISGDRVGQPFSSPDISPSPLHEYIYEVNDSLRKHWNTPGYGANKNASWPNGRISAKDPLTWGYTPGKFRRIDAADPWDIDASNEAISPVVVLETPEPLHQSLTGINYPLLRYSDVLLMFAEAENELNGPSAEAQDAINQVRARAGIKTLAEVKPDAIASQADFFTEITEERFRELCFEGHRKHDLIRWGLL